ncbi:hypothetical protein WN51_14551 [Melipona quadrifasciata]|uniref:Uncharacterized protein n=1 Tax=Melipona quadrifasciata TaxID=166423 RepID=A0A0N0BFG7_9HYME|nr:hypothetical protein WN51_14551 [Melipona quadrifasciata]
MALTSSHFLIGDVLTSKTEKDVTNKTTNCIMSVLSCTKRARVTESKYWCKIKLV